MAESPAETLDLRTVPCPANAARALIKLETMDAGALLEILISGGEPLVNLPESVLQAGHEIVERTELPGNLWKLLIRRC